MPERKHFLFTRRFAPHFISMAASAFDDCLLRSALVTLITFGTAKIDGIDTSMLVTVTMGIYVLPFLVFSSLAGEISEKYEKSSLMKKIRLAEVVLVFLMAASFITKSAGLIMFMLFMMGVKSTFYGPMKFSVLPQYLNEDELVEGNGVLSAGTNVAILVGTICGGVFTMLDGGLMIVSVLAIISAVGGYAASRSLPEAPAAAPDMRIDPNIARSTWKIVSFAFADRLILYSLMGILFFYFIGSLMLAQIPLYTKIMIGGDQNVSTFLFVVFSLGTVAGSSVCGKILSGRVSGRSLLPSLIGISVFCAALFAEGHTPVDAPTLFGIGEFFGMPFSYIIIATIFLLSFCGALYSVPLYAIQQKVTPSQHLSRTIAALNIITTLGMIAATLFAGVIYAVGLTVGDVMLATGILALVFMPVTLRLAKEKYE
ncbi:MAG: MFS transporter [Synergistes sp.]|nr:MFS transporter [Synergistes sp.]